MAPAAPDRALRARTAMIGRDPLARNRDAVEKLARGANR
jgi:hypothetical protein